jgi:hypothetical protein
MQLMQGVYLCVILITLALMAHLFTPRGRS